ncbi:hypothetical protein E2320_001851 [Naja naja]|nr:hypothetical protein E2320_001851 [Naja naja]
MQLNPSSGDPLGFEGVHTDLPVEASLALSPECLIHKSEDPGLLQTLSADATECLPARQPINVTSMNWSALRALQPYEQGLPPPTSLPLSPKRVTLPFNNGCWGRRCGTTEFTNYIQSFDVVLLQETWSCNKISLTGFTVTSLAATK